MTCLAENDGPIVDTIWPKFSHQSFGELQLAVQLRRERHIQEDFSSDLLSEEHGSNENPARDYYLEVLGLVLTGSGRCLYRHAMPDDPEIREAACASWAVWTLNFLIWKFGIGEKEVSTRYLPPGLPLTTHGDDQVWHPISEIHLWYSANECQHGASSAGIRALRCVSEVQLSILCNSCGALPGTQRPLDLPEGYVSIIPTPRWWGVNHKSKNCSNILQQHPFRIFSRNFWIFSLSLGI